MVTGDAMYEVRDIQVGSWMSDIQACAWISDPKAGRLVNDIHAGSWVNDMQAGTITNYSLNIAPLQLQIVVSDAYVHRHDGCISIESKKECL